MAQRSIRSLTHSAVMKMPRHVRHDRCGAVSPRHRQGFTLIEMLVSMALLSVIVLIAARLFQQGSQAWTSGTQRTEINITGRTLADFMAREIAQAVKDEANSAHEFNCNGGSITFTVLRDPSQGAGAPDPLITYSFAGNSVNRQISSPAQSATLADGIDNVTFTLPASPPSDTLPLPEYVDVSVTVRNSDPTSHFVSRAYLVNRRRYVMD
jgi:prepilin-type N-terminal cleavage/methylation domain-containing protein